MLEGLTGSNIDIKRRKNQGAILLLSGILALFFHYNENTLAWFETYIWYIGTPLLVLAPIFIYWAGRGKT